jgi:hypothetical protein
MRKNTINTSISMPVELHNDMIKYAGDNVSFFVQKAIRREIKREKFRDAREFVSELKEEERNLLESELIKAKKGR